MSSLTLGGATSDNVSFGSAASLDNLSPMTFLCILRATTLTAGRVIVGKQNTATAGLRFTVDTTVGTMNLRRQRATTALNYSANTLPLVTGKWMLAAFTMDMGATPAAHIYRADKDTPIAECGYSASNNGSGTPTSDASYNLRVGNDDRLTVAFQGDIAVVAIFNRVLTIQEIQDWYHNPRGTISGCVLYSRLGWYGTGTQPDWSGSGNNGTASGASLNTGPAVPRPGAGRRGCSYCAMSSGATLHTQSVGGTFSSAGALVRSTGKPLAGTVSSAGSLTSLRSRLLSLAGTVSSAGTLVRSTGKLLAGAVASAGTLVRSAAKTLAGTVSSSGALGTIKTRLLSLAGTVTSAGAITRSTSKALGGTVPSAGALQRLTGKPLAGTVTSAGILSSIKTRLLSLAGTFGSAGALSRSTGKGLAGSTAPAGSLQKGVGKLLGGAVAPSGDLTLTRVALLALAGTVGAAGTLVRSVGKVLAGAVGPTGTIRVSVSKLLAGTIASAGALTRTVQKVLGGVVGIVGALTTLLLGLIARPPKGRWTAFELNDSATGFSADQPSSFETDASGNDFDLSDPTP